MGILFRPEKEKRRYQRGWGHQGLSLQQVVCSRTVSFQDRNGKSTDLHFDLFNDDSPLSIGMDLQQFSSTNFIDDPPTLTILRPTDIGERVVQLYLSGTSPFELRRRILIVPTVHTMLSKTLTELPPKSLARRLHRLTHAPYDELVAICESAGHLSEELKKEIRRITSECPVCAKSGPPPPSKKVSVTHVSQAFNVELQVDFTFLEVRGTKYTLMHMVDTGTGLSEGSIVSNRDANTMCSVLDTEWMNRHGEPGALTADDEFNNRKIARYLRSRGIRFKPRPARRHNKTGIVERKNGVVKRILEKLQLDQTESTNAELISRAIFLANMFTGSKTLSSFELARGYAPSILGTPRRMVTEELMDAYKKQTATRKLQKLLKGRNYSSLGVNAIKPGDDVLFYYRSSKQNEPDEWKSGIVSSVSEHIIEVRRPGSRLNSKVAVEDIRLRPNSDLARELSEGVMEDYIDLTLNAESIEDMPEDDEVCENLMVTTETEMDAVRKDLGHHAETILTEELLSTPTSLESSEQKVLEDVAKTIGSRQVTLREMQFAPPWLLKKAIEKEHADNWSNAYTEVDEKEIPQGANVISSHTVFKVKEDEDHVRKLKARLVTHGNHDNMKDEVRKDCSNADMIVVRLLISVALCLGFCFGVADKKGAYLQSGPIRREIYVRPPKEFKKKNGILWKLKKLPYGIVDAGRQWAKRIKDWMLGTAGLTRVFGINQLFVGIYVLVAKVVDDLLVAGSNRAIEDFMKKLETEFNVGKIRIEPRITFAGCTSEQDDDGNVLLSMNEYIKRLTPAALSKARRRERSDKATAEEIHEYRSHAGTLMYLGSAVLPQASFVTSRMQQEIGTLRVSHIIEANAMLAEVLQLKPEIRFIRPLGVSEVSLISLSDASHDSGSNSYGQTGILTGLKIETSFDEEPVFHPLYWVSNKG